MREFTPAHAAQVCGLKADDIVQAARWFAGTDGSQTAHRTPTLSLYCQGLNQSTQRHRQERALINLHLATGQIGKPGAGPFSLTGQPNAMGGREVGGLANLLSAHRDLANAEHRAEVAALWGVRRCAGAAGQDRGGDVRGRGRRADQGAVDRLHQPGAVDARPGDGAARACSAPSSWWCRRPSPTPPPCAYADLLLPATSWGEKDGTVTNSERRISRVRAAVPAPGEARDDWRIAVDFARRLERRAAPRAGRDGRTLFPYDTPKASGTNTAKAPAAATSTSPA